MALERDRSFDYDYDGIQEFDNPLPRWWLLLLFGTMIFAVVYVPWYHLGPGELPREEWVNISMNVATIMVASVALGIVDDDTIHFINRYRREAEAGATTDDAIQIATAHEGRASLTTAIINSVGYAVLLMSEYKPTAWFGGLLALTMGTAFLAEVFILPATIKLLPRLFGAEALARTHAKVVAPAARARREDAARERAGVGPREH